MWKSTQLFFQSCYNRAFTTFCTRERHSQKSLRSNGLTISDALITHLVHLILQYCRITTPQQSGEHTVTRWLKDAGARRLLP